MDDPNTSVFAVIEPAAPCVMPLTADKVAVPPTLTAELIPILPLDVMFKAVVVLMVEAVTLPAVISNRPISLDEPTAPPIVTLPVPAVRFKREGARLVSSTYWFRL